MSKYICDRCGLATHQKFNFVRHLSRKHTCHPKNSDISTSEIAQKYGLLQFGLNPKNYNLVMSQNEPKMSQNEPVMSQNEPNEFSSQNSNTETNDCIYCSKRFKTKPNLRKHQIHRCKLNTNRLDLIKRHQKK